MGWFDLQLIYATKPIAGKMGSRLAHASDPLASQRPLDDREYALDHIAAKLAKLPASMQTAAGRKMGELRLQRILAFREWSVPFPVDTNLRWIIATKEQCS